MSKIRVVYLDHCAEPSGAELALVEVLEHLDEVDVDAHVILGAEGPLTGRLAAAASTEVIPLPGRVAGVGRAGASGPLDQASAGLATLGYAARLAWRLRQLRPDLVHANSLKSGIYGALAARMAGAPLVWHVRDRLTPDYLNTGLLRMVNGLIRHAPALVVANSEATAGTVRTSRPVRVVHSPVNVTAGPVTRSGPDPLTFATLSRLSPWKGQHEFLEAFAQAFPSGPERAVIFGAALFGEDDYAASLPRVAQRLGIADRVRFAGHVADIGAALAGVDIVVHTPTIPEPFGRVVAEAMAAGLPVIAPDEGGPAEIVTHGSTGLLVQPRDTAAVASAMRRLAADPGLRRRLGAAAPQAVADLAPSRVAARLREVYDEVLAGPSSRAVEPS